MSKSKYIVNLESINDALKPRVGGKAFALSFLKKSGFTVPNALVVTIDAYQEFINKNGLANRISFELGRKPFSEMRWEELWDASLRIQNMVLRSEIPAQLRQQMKEMILEEIGNSAVVVRSSAPGEDSTSTSFAGIHESFVNITGLDAILEHVRLVWASLWSDAALLYRKEIGLDPEESSMAVIIQELVIGRASGVTFTINPSDRSTSVTEAVHGLNQGLVDGTIEPDRWILERPSGEIVSHYIAERISYIGLSPRLGVEKLALEKTTAKLPPLSIDEVVDVVNHAIRIEKKAGCPQDVEWTFRGKKLFLLQARPITTGSNDDSNDKRSWYLSLRRSFENLNQLGDKIENTLIPEMKRVAESLANINLESFSDDELEVEIDQRQKVHTHWIDVYWTEFIPFAHGVRLFGQLYNRTVRPADPYEFVDLLSDTGLLSVKRNSMLENIAAYLRDNSELVSRIKDSGLVAADKGLISLINTYIGEFGELNCSDNTNGECGETREILLKTVMEMSTRIPSQPKRKRLKATDLKTAFLERFNDDDRKKAEGMLDLARTSYRLRDDDNIYLGRIETQKLEAVKELNRRKAGLQSPSKNSLSFAERIGILNQADKTPGGSLSVSMAPPGFILQARQLTGQPASEGFARGLSRVILSADDLASFRQGEILVCDAVDPTMTYIVPLAAGIVERRGGMLIHGAIIAREYGIPCVTGISDATKLITTGNHISIDGYLGIITISSSDSYQEAI